MDYDREALLAAVNHLTLQPDIGEEGRILAKSVRMLGDLPVRLVGPMAILNPLIHLAQTDYAAFRRVLELIRRKRSHAGLDYRALEEPQTSTDYMRGFMAQKRERERRAVAIENMLRPASDQLVGRPRLAFMQKMSGEWKKRRDRMLAAERARAGGSISKQRLQELLAAFWAEVDHELDELERMAREALLAAQEIEKPRRGGHRGKV